MFTQFMYAALLAPVMTSRSSACLRMLADVPNAYEDALWIIRRLASFMILMSPAIKITDAAEHANPSQTVTTVALWFFNVL